MSRDAAIRATSFHFDADYSMSLCLMRALLMFAAPERQELML